MKDCKIIISVRDTATYPDTHSLIHWLKNPIPMSKADNVIENVKLVVNGLEVKT